MVLLLTLRGTPTLYYADELGHESVPIPPERVRDPVRHQHARRHPRPRSRAHAHAVGRLRQCRLQRGRALAAARRQRGRDLRRRAEARSDSMLSLTRSLLALRRREAASRSAAGSCCRSKARPWPIRAPGRTAASSSFSTWNRARRRFDWAPASPGESSCRPTRAVPARSSATAIELRADEAVVIARLRGGSRAGRRVSRTGAGLAIDQRCPCR